MNYSENGDRVTLEMSLGEWQNLMVLAGMGVAASRLAGNAEFHAWIRFVNEMNRTNPRYTPYEVPESSTAT